MDNQSVDGAVLSLPSPGLRNLEAADAQYRSLGTPMTHWLQSSRSRADRSHTLFELRQLGTPDWPNIDWRVSGGARRPYAHTALISKLEKDRQCE
jgi:hypothetical protein